MAMTKKEAVKDMKKMVEKKGIKGVVKAAASKSMDKRMSAMKKTGSTTGMGAKGKKRCTTAGSDGG